MNPVGADESRAHGADHNVVLFDLSSEAVEETHGGMLGGCIWKKDQSEMGTGRAPTLLLWGSTVNQWADTHPSSERKGPCKLPGLNCYNRFIHCLAGSLLWLCGGWLSP